MQSRRNAVYIIISLSLLAGLTTGRPFFFNVAYAFIGLLVLAFVWAWTGANWLRLRRQTRARRAQVGQYLEERFTVRNSGVLPKLWLEIYDESDLPGHRASHVVSNIAPRSDASWPVRTMCIRRGAFQLGPLRIVTGDPFGLFQAERRISVTSPLIVYPQTVDVFDFSLPVGSLPGGEALRRRTQQITTNAAGVRDYAPGDSFSRIHWRSTARKDRLIVKEFELDPLADIWLMLDADRTVQAGRNTLTEDEVKAMLAAEEQALPPTTEEYSITIAASLARYFLQQDRAVGFTSYSEHREVIPADRGGRQLSKILESLAVMQMKGVLTFEQVMAMQGRQLTRGTTVILITSSTRESWLTAAHGLMRRGLRVIAILVDPHGFGGRPGADRMAAQLTTVGIPTYLIKRGDDLSAALSQPRY